MTERVTADTLIQAGWHTSWIDGVRRWHHQRPPAHFKTLTDAKALYLEYQTPRTECPQAIKTAIEERRRAEKALAEILKLSYPLGAAIQWEIGGNRQRGSVVMHCYGDRIKVRNTRTERERFIYATDIVC